MIKFYDTNSLLHLQDKAFIDKFYISIVTLRELENIKVCKNKDDQIKYQARNLVRLLTQQPYMYEVIQTEYDDASNMANDAKIIKAALALQERDDIEVVFVTEDLCCKILAEAENLKVRSTLIEDCEKPYLGFRELKLSNDELAIFYENKDEYINNIKSSVLENEYILINDDTNTTIDVYKYSNGTLGHFPYLEFNSIALGKIKPLDVYQKCAMDSLVSNEMTVLCGKPGSGKTYLGLGYLMQELEHENIDRIVLFCNPVVAKGAAKLGYLPGTAREKILSSQTGNILGSKFGSLDIVHKLISDEKIILIPAGDARGYQTPPHSGVYILEAQNLSKELIKLILQRIGDHCKIIIDGDYGFEQIDLDIYMNSNNGMRKMVEIFKGQTYYGQVELQNIHRSKIAALAENIK